MEMSQEEQPVAMETNESKAGDVIESAKEQNKDDVNEEVKIGLEIKKENDIENNEGADTTAEGRKNKGNTQEELDKIIQEIGICMGNEESNRDEMEGGDVIKEEENEGRNEQEDKENIGEYIEGRFKPVHTDHPHQSLLCVCDWN